MRFANILALVAIVTVIACAERAAPRPVVSENTLESVLSDPRPRSMSGEEQKIVEELVALFPQSAEMVRKMLTDRRVASIELPGDKAKTLLARLDSIRGGRSESVSTTASSRTVVTASVVLVDRLEDPTADVIVVRRTNPPADLILIQQRGANATKLGAGIAALFRLREQFGDEANQDMHLVVHNAKMPKKWPPELKQEAARIVSTLRAKEKTKVRGVGDARAIEIPLVAMGR